MTFDLEHLRSWIGRTETADDIVTPRLLAEYRATFAPHLAPVGERDAPWMLHWCMALPTAPMKDIAADGHPKKGGFLPPVPLPRRMWAGGRVEIRAPLREGDAVTRHSRIAEVAIKEGRTGKLCFVTVQHEYRTERDLAVTERQDIVYREAAGEAAAAPPPAPAPAERRKADLVWTIESTPVLLFRYSALIFNAHRIHYDEGYCRTEGYDGLVVHGPLQASCLFNLAAVLGGRAPASFDYRGVSALTGCGPFRVCGARDDDGVVRCWTEGQDGRVCMEAQARVSTVS